MLVIYSKNQCQQCTQAKMILDMKKIPYDLKMLDVDFTREELSELAPSQRSFPVIFKDGELVGGFIELRKLIM